MIRPHPTYLRSQRKQEYGSNYNFSQFSSKNYILLSVGTPDLSDTSLVADVPRNPAPLRRWITIVQFDTCGQNQIIKESGKTANTIYFKKWNKISLEAGI